MRECSRAHLLQEDDPQIEVRLDGLGADLDRALKQLPRLRKRKAKQQAASAERAGERASA